MVNPNWHGLICGLFKVLKNIFYDFILYEKLGLNIIVELKVEKRMTNSVSFSL